MWLSFTRLRYVFATLFINLLLQAGVKWNYAFIIYMGIDKIKIKFKKNRYFAKKKVFDFWESP